MRRMLCAVVLLLLAVGMVGCGKTPERFEYGELSYSSGGVLQGASWRDGTRIIEAKHTAELVDKLRGNSPKRDNDPMELFTIIGREGWELTTDFVLRTSNSTTRTMYFKRRL